MRILAILIALAAAQPAFADPPVQVIVADNSQECGIYRLAMHRRQDNERTAYKLAASFEAKGIRTRVIVINPGQFVGQLKRTTATPLPVFVNNPC